MKKLILANLIFVLGTLAGCGGSGGGASSDVSNGTPSFTPSPNPPGTSPTPVPGPTPAPVTPTPVADSTPVANPDSYSLDEGATLQVNAAAGLLGNDTNPLTSILTASIVQAPKYGNLDLKADGSFTYVHDHSETTQDSFIYSINNGSTSAQATVALTINPVADAPIITKLELAQTHVIPAQGKSWQEAKLTKYNLHLLGDRDALVMLDIAAPNGRVANPVVEAYVKSVKVGEVALNSAKALPPTEAAGVAYSDTAYWVNLDKAWIKPGLELLVRANEGQKTPFTSVKVGAAAEFTMYTLPFYLFGINETTIPLATTAAPDLATHDEYLAKHPFSALNAVNHAAKKIEWPYIIVAPRNGGPAQKVAYKEQQGDGYAVMSAVLNTLGAMRSANGDESMNNQYYAPLLMATQAGKYGNPGGGLGGGGVGTGDYSYTGVFIHEAGHGFGMPHANDGYTAGTFPYVGGSLKGSNWGYDQFKKEFLPTLCNWLRSSPTPAKITGSAVTQAATIH
jgi:VCBS repeat-containing protein